MPFNPKSLQNLEARGRPKGSINRATRLKRELMAPGSALTETPTQILAANMSYFQRKAEEFERDGRFELVCKCKVLANDTAAQLAPYVHSKMPTLVVQPDQEAQQYVIRVPDALPDGQAWSHAITDMNIGATATKTITAD